MKDTNFTVPKSITLGGQRIRILISDSLEDWGEYDHDRKTIELAARCLKSRKLFIETARHELVHAALAVSGVSYSQNYEEECIVRCLDDLFFPALDRLERLVKVIDKQPP